MTRSAQSTFHSPVLRYDAMTLWAFLLISVLGSLLKISRHSVTWSSYPGGEPSHILWRTYSRTASSSSLANSNNLFQKFPEVRLIALYPTRAHLLGGLQSYLTVFVHGKCDDFLNAFGFADLSKLFTDVFICGRLRLLLVVDLGPLVRHFVYQLYLSKLDLDHSLISEILSQSYHCI